MSDKAYRDLIQRYDRELAADRAAYEAKLRRLIWIARLYLLAALLGLSIALFGSLLLLARSWLFLIVAAQLALVLSSALMLLRRHQRGIEEAEEFITREQAPGLYHTIEALGPPVESVELLQRIDHFWVIHSPRFGLFGPPRAQAGIGLFALLTLSEQQTRALIARTHYTPLKTTQNIWLQAHGTAWSVMWTLANERLATRLPLKPLIDHILPHIEAMTIALIRAHNREVDQAFAAHEHARDLAEALIRLQSADASLDLYFDRTVKLRRDPDAPPPRTLISDLATHLKGAYRSSDDDEALRRALTRHTHPTDTISCVADRLRALQLSPEALEHARDPIERSAAEAWFANLPSYLAHADRVHHHIASEQWEQVSAFIKKRESLIERIESGQYEDMSEQEASFLLARLRRTRGERDLAISLLRRHVQRWPDDQRAKLLLGEVLVRDADDEAGVQLIEGAISLELGASVEAMEAVIERCFARGELDEADRWQTKLDEWRAASLLAYERRCRITPHTKLMRHGLDAELIAQLQGQLRERIPEQTRRWISGLWLARKRDVAFLPNEPLYIIGFTCRWALLRRDGAEIKRLLDEQIELPSQLIAVDLSPVNMMRLREHISSIDGSRLI